MRQYAGLPPLKEGEQRPLALMLAEEVIVACNEETTEYSKEREERDDCKEDGAIPPYLAPSANISYALPQRMLEPTR